VGSVPYLKMVYKDGFFHGDLHAGNLLILPNNPTRSGRFGVVGRSTGVLKSDHQHVPRPGERGL